MLSDSQVVTVGPEGTRVTPINEIFRERLQLSSGEFLVQIATEKNDLLRRRFFTFKKTPTVGYWLSINNNRSLKKIDNEIRVALSGLCPFPFRSQGVEAALNNKEMPESERIERALASLPERILDDVEGSANYRLFVLRNLLLDVLESLDKA
ncbi:hypothetical protein GCM10020331_061750 [Ectobacillus funiculus]